MAKKSTKVISYQETYKKNTLFSDKQHVVDMIMKKNTQLLILKAGAYEDGSEFITITIDNIDFNEK